MDLPYGTMREALRSDGKTFFGLHLYLAGRSCEIPQVPETPLNVNPAQVRRLVGVTNAWLVGITIYCTLLQSHSPPPGQFLHKKYFKKN